MIDGHAHQGKQPAIQCMKEGPAQNGDLPAAGESASWLLTFLLQQEHSKNARPDSAFGFVLRKEYGPGEDNEYLWAAVAERQLHVLFTCVLLVEDGKCLMCCTSWSEMKL